MISIFPSADPRKSLAQAGNAAMVEHVMASVANQRIPFFIKFPLICNVLKIYFLSG